MHLEIDLLRTFAVAAETLNFSRTGARLGRVQSAVSDQINRLEIIVGTSVFDRGRGRAMTLTPVGLRLLEHARTILRLDAEALADLRGEQTKTNLRFGTTETYASTLLPRAIRLFSTLNPQVAIEVRCGKSTELLTELDDGTLDLVVVTDQGRKSGKLSSCSTSLVWVSGPMFRLSLDGPLPVAFMPEGCEFRAVGQTALDHALLPWWNAVSSPSPAGIRAALQAGMAISVLPKVCVDESLKILHAEDGLPALGNINVTVHSQPGDASSWLKSLATEIVETL